MLIRLCKHEICSWSFFSPPLTVLTNNFGLNCFFLLPILAIINPFLKEKMVPNKFLTSLLFAFARMTVCRLGWWPSHCHLSPAARTGHIQRASWQGCRFYVWGWCGIEPSCKPYPVCCSNMMWLKPVCDEWLNFRGEKLQCKNQLLLLCGWCDTDEISTARWSEGSFGLGCA